MRLRTILLLFFGTLIALLAGFIVWRSQNITWDALLKEKSASLSLEAYEVGREGATKRMQDAVSRIILAVGGKGEGDWGLNANFNSLNGFLKHQEDAEGFLLQLRAASPDLTPWIQKADRGEALSEDEDALFEAWINLKSLHDESVNYLGDATLTETAVQKSTGAEFDVLVIARPNGQVLVEHLTDQEGTPPGPVLGESRPLGARRAKNLEEMLSVSDLVRNGSQTLYIPYPDGRLYFVQAIVDYYQSGEPRLIAVFGQRLDDQFAREASRVTNQAQVRILFEGQVIGNSAEKPKEDLLGPSLVHFLATQAPSPEKTTETLELTAGPYLSQNLELKTPAGDTTGYIFFLMSLENIQQKVAEVTRDIVVTGVGALVLCLVLVPLLANWLTGPMVKLSRRMTRVPEGELSDFEEDEMTGSIEVRQAARAFNAMVTGLRQKEVLEGFVPVQAREQIEKGRGEALKMGGERVHRTILFSDLRGFTSLSEKLRPDEVVDLLNQYLDRMTRVIRGHRHRGDINEYIGDAILAVFKDRDGARSERLAVSAALEMNRELEKLQAETDNEHLKKMRQGIGIHSGELVVGNIGTSDPEDKELRRVKAAVVGDTVNLAARIQDRSRDGKHTCILISGDTRAALSGDYQLEFFGDESFKGKEKPVPVWEVVDGP